MRAMYVCLYVVHNYASTHAHEYAVYPCLHACKNVLVCLEGVSENARPHFDAFCLVRYILMHLCNLHSPCIHASVARKPNTHSHTHTDKHAS